MAWSNRRSKLRKLAEGLVKVGALQFGTFTLPEGRDSAYFIDLGSLPSYPGVYGLVAGVIEDLVSRKAPKADALFGVQNIGLALAAPAAVSLKKPLVYQRSRPRAGKSGIEGDLRPGWKVVVVDDVATSGRTILSSAKALEQEGCVATQAVVLIDRLEGARERLSSHGISLYAFTDVVEISDILFSMELITKENLKAITKSVGGR